MCDLSALLLSDSEHDVWSGVGAAASKRGDGQEDCSSGRETGLHPSQCAVTARCAFSSDNKATKGFPGRLGLSCPRPVILPELWVLSGPCPATLSRIHHTRDTLQLIGFAQWFPSYSATFFLCWRIFSTCTLPLLKLCYTIIQLHTFTLGVTATESCRGAPMRGEVFQSGGSRGRKRHHSCVSKAQNC